MFAYVVIGLAVVFIVSHILRKYFYRKEGRRAFIWWNRMAATRAVSGILGVVVVLVWWWMSFPGPDLPTWIIRDLVAEARSGSAVESGKVQEVLPIPGTSLAYVMVVLDSDSAATFPFAYPVLVAAAEAPESGEQVRVRSIEHRHYRYLDSTRAKRSPALFASPIWILLTPADSAP